MVPSADHLQADSRSLYIRLWEKQNCTVPLPLLFLTPWSSRHNKTKSAHCKQDQVNRNMFRNSGVYVLWSLWRKNVYGQASLRLFFPSECGNTVGLKGAVSSCSVSLYLQCGSDSSMALSFQRSTMECEAIKNKPSSYFRHTLVESCLHVLRMTESIM